MRILAAVGLALCLFGAWVSVLWKLYPFMLRTSDGAIFSLAAGGAALLALSARLAGRSRWAVGISLLLILEAVGGYFALLGGAFGAPGVGGLVAGLLAALIIGPAVLWFPVAADADSGRMPVPTPAARTRLRRLRLGALGMGLGVPALLAIFPLVSAVFCYWKMNQVRRDVLPAVEELVRTDILVQSGPILWDPVRWEYARSGGGCASGYLSNLPAGAGVGTPGPLVSLGMLHQKPARRFGRSGKAEGLKVDGLLISLPPGAALGDREAKQLPAVKRLLLSAGVRPGLVSGLSVQNAKLDPSARYVVSRNGVTYSFSIWTPARKDSTHLSIMCSGVRTATSP